MWFLESSPAAENAQSWRVALAVKLRELAARLAPDESDEDDTSLDARLKKLRSKAISALNAWRCCIQAKRQAQKLGFDWIQKVEEIMSERPMEARVIPIQPSVLRHVRLFRAVESPAYVMGWSSRSEGEVIGNVVPIPETQAEMELVRQHVSAIVDTIRKLEPDCLECVERRVWGQSVKRRKVWTEDGVMIYRRAPGGSKP